MSLPTCQDAPGSADLRILFLSDLANLTLRTAKALALAVTDELGSVDLIAIAGIKAKDQDMYSEACEVVQFLKSAFKVRPIFLVPNNLDLDDYANYEAFYMSQCGSVINDRSSVENVKFAHVIWEKFQNTLIAEVERDGNRLRIVLSRNPVRFLDQLDEADDPQLRIDLNLVGSNDQAAEEPITICLPEFAASCLQFSPITNTLIDRRLTFDGCWTVASTDVWGREDPMGYSYARIYRETTLANPEEGGQEVVLC